MSYVGKSINVINGNKSSKEEVVKELKSKGLIRTKEGNEYAIAELFNKGRGVFIDITPKGKRGSKAAEKPAAAPKASTKPADKTGYVAKAVTLAELEGKKIDGQSVERIKRASKQVILADGTTVELADVRRVGKGYSAGGSKPAAKPAAAPKASAKGGAAKKPAAKKAAAEVLEPRNLKGEVVLIDGEEELIEKVYKSGRMESTSGVKFTVDDLSRNGDDELVLHMEEEEEIEEEEEDGIEFENEGDDEKTVPAKISEMKGEVIYVDGVKQIIKGTDSKHNRIKTDAGVIIDVANIEVEDNDFVTETKRGSVIPKRIFPSAESGPMAVPSFDASTAADIADVAENSVRSAISKLYNAPLMHSITVAEDNFLLVGLYFAADGVSQNEIAEKIQEIQSNHTAGASYAVVEREEEEEDDEQEEEQEEEAEAEEEFAFGDDTPEEDDIEVLIGNSVEALRNLFGVDATKYVTNWFDSEEAAESIGTDVLPGITTLEQDGNNYVVFGLDDKGNIIVVNTERNAAGKMVNLRDVSYASLSRMEVVE